MSERKVAERGSLSPPEGFSAALLVVRACDAVFLDVFARFLCGVRRCFFFCGAYTVQRVSGNLCCGYKRHYDRWFPTVRAMFTKDRLTYLGLCCELITENE